MGYEIRHALRANRARSSKPFPFKAVAAHGASHSWVTFNLGRARFKQYCLLPTVIRQTSDETPPDKGSQLNCSGFDSRPTRLIVSQIDSRVSGSATEPDGLIDRHFELGERTTAQGMHLEYTRNFRANKRDLNARGSLTIPTGVLASADEVIE